MVGTLESQFLKLQVQVSGAKKVLDIGTFTGMSALAMAEGLPKSGKVVTLENNDKCADVAENAFGKAEHGYKIQLKRGNAVDHMKQMLKGKFLQLVLSFFKASSQFFHNFYSVLSLLIGLSFSL